MRAPLRPLLLLHPDPYFRARIEQAAGRHFGVEPVASWDALGEALRAASPAALAVVDPYFGMDSGVGLAPELRRLLREFPSTSVLAAVEARIDRFADLRALGEWGVAEVISEGEQDAVAIGRLLRSVRGRPLQNLLERALPPNTGARARQILAAAVDVAAANGQTPDLARALHASLRTLLRWCDDAGLPPPRRLLAWLRLLLAAELLDDPGRGVESVAHACGYAADSGLRRALRSFTGAGARSLCRNGAFAVVSEKFRAALTEEVCEGVEVGANR